MTVAITNVVIITTENIKNIIIKNGNIDMIVMIVGMMMIKQIAKS